MTTETHATSEPTRPPAWAVLERALTDKRPVRVRYHGHARVLCPHALGWKNGRPKVLSYQAGGTTSHGPLPDDPQQGWRSMFVDEIQDPTITDGPWETADNHSHNSNCIDELEIAVDGPVNTRGGVPTNSNGDSARTAC